MMKKLPIGMQTFSEIRENSCYYVDKTERIHSLITGSGKAFFLSRPRRFGKSLLCSTLASVFEGRRELFQNLAIDSLEWEWKKHPVLHLDFNTGNFSLGLNGLNTTLKSALENCAIEAGVKLRGELPVDIFKNLIFDLHQSFNEKVVVIIDEYDNPLLSTFDDSIIHNELRSALKGFYGSIKSSDKYLRFVFITGVTKFSKVSIFSGLNQLLDLSLDPQFTDICGITQDELERDFEDEINEVINNKNYSRETYLARLKQFYNGYRFSKNLLTVYNPFGLLLHFYHRGDFKSYWFETGSPGFLIELIENQNINILDIEKRTVGDEEFGKYDVENMPALPVLYQSGYLTIVDYDEKKDRYTLDYPNEEVRVSFAKSLINLYLHAKEGASNTLIWDLPDMLSEGNIDGVMKLLISFFASIPYDMHVEKERYYQLIVYLVFRLLGRDCCAEVRTATGRIDTLVETGEYVYCFEFKLNGSAEEALKQIDDKEYLLPWKATKKKLLKVGVNFDYEKRNIGEWVIGG
jgi:hypothetical protein